MSEQEKPKSSYMQELDLWTDANVVGPLANADPRVEEEWEPAVEGVKKAIRTKTLESYHNGQRTPAKAQRGGRYGR
jgi:hypothetical protein